MSPANTPFALSNELKNHCGQDDQIEAIPWSYAAVLFNLPTSVITRLRQPWGEEFVLGKTDLENPNILMNRIRLTFPPKRMRPLTRSELNYVRATIYPAVEIDMDDRPPVILDNQQEKLVAEPVVQHPEPPKKTNQQEPQPLQTLLFESDQANTIDNELPAQENLPTEADRISQNVSIRLVRGFSGSGKTLVLVQRAKFIAAQYPEWKIGVLTYNKPLQEQLVQTFKGTSIQPRTFHGLCRRWVDLPEDKEYKLSTWLNQHKEKHPILQTIGRDLVEREINWVRDIGITSRDQYLALDRKGVGKTLRLLTQERHSVFDILEAYRAYLQSQEMWDWAEVPLMTLQALDQTEIKESDLYDMILVDEAQDWAPVWFKVINRLIHPEHGCIFLADDPSQSIFRYFSWKEKSVPVVGRTRWLRVPYRNTFEIYRAAYGLIANHPDIQRSLAEEGEVIEPDFSSQSMRHGEIPLLRKCKSAADELETIKKEITLLRQDGYNESQVAVLARYRRDIEPIKKALQGTQVRVEMIHSFKGLEMEGIIIPHLHSTFINADDETGERRLLYMALSRARSRLVLTYAGRLPAPYDELRRQGLVISSID